MLHEETMIAPEKSMSISGPGAHFDMSLWHSSIAAPVQAATRMSMTRASLGLHLTLLGKSRLPPLDPITFSLAPVLLFVAAFAACLIPGYRASTIDPMNALRHE
jgi:ABC-type lipoprotein release transport system permease subunit